MVWGLSLISLLAFLLGFASHSPGWLGLGLVVGFGCGLAAALVFIDRHMRASARTESMSAGEIAALRSTLRPAVEPPRKLPPAASRDND